MQCCQLIDIEETRLRVSLDNPFHFTYEGYATVLLSVIIMD